MIRLPFRVALFLSSYSPLFLLLAWSSRDSWFAWWVLVLIAGVSIVMLLVVMFSLRASSGPRITVKRAQPDDGEVLAYIATYLVPFFGLDLGTSDDLVVLIGFLVVLGVVYVNSSMLLVNPVLSFVGYHSFRVTDEDDNEYHVIARRREIVPGLIFRPAQIDTYLRIEVSP